MRRSILVALATASGAVLLGSCADDAAGPREPIAGRFSVVPNFGALQGDVVEVVRGRFVVTRIPSGAVAADTIVDIAPDADSVDLAIQVPVFEPGETFQLTIRLIDANGDTVFAGGPIEVSPTTSGTPVPVEVPFDYVGTGAAAAGVAILNADTSLFTGEGLLLTAVAFDSSEAAIPGTPIGWESLDTAVVRITGRNAQYQGTAVGGNQRGVARIVATLVTGQTDTVLVSNQPVPTALLAESGDNQSGLAGSPLPQPLVVRVTAGDGQGVTGIWVRFAVTSGGGTVSADSVLTDATGRAAVSYTLARTFQPHVVTATTARLGTASAVFNATLIFAPPATLEIVTGDGQTAVAGSAVAVAPQVRVLDAQGLPVPGITVTFAVTAGGGIVAGGTPATDTLGLAAVAGWTLGTAAGANTLTATVDALTATFTATGVAGAASQLVLVSGNAQIDTVGQVLPLPLVVRATDANGNGVAGATIDWSAANGGVSAPTTVTDSDGLAEVLWTLGATPGSQAATATLQGTAATVPFTATAAPGAAARLSFTVEPTEVREDSVITPAVVVTAYDAFDNVATGFTGTVQLSLLTNPGGATLGGTTTRAAAAGVATFDDLSLNAFGNGYSFLASAAGSVPDTSAVFDVLAPAGQAFWINASGGNWNDPANWLAGSIPVSTDTVFITIAGTYTVTLDQATTVERLQIGGVDANPTFAHTTGLLTVNATVAVESGAVYALSGGALGGPHSGTIAGTFTWNSGALSGAGTTTLASGGASTWPTNGSKFLNGRTLVLDGPVTWSGGGTLQLENQATLINNGTLSYTSASIGAFGSVSGPNLVTNAGTFVKTGAGAFSIVTPFDNTGTVDHQAGTMTLTGGGTSSGPFTVGTGATLDFLAGTHTLAGDVTGTGAVTVSGATVAVGAAATYAMPALIQTSGTVTVNGTLGALDSIRVGGGTLNLQTPVAAITVPRLSLLGGALQGTDSVVVSNAWDWTGGTLGLGFALASGAAATWSTNNSRFLNAHTLVLDGPVTWSGGGTLQLQNVATLINNGTLSYTSANIGAFGNVSGPNLVTNAGSFVKTGTGAFTVVTPFSNSGVLDVQTGLVGMNNTFSHADGAVLQGAGTLDLANATVSAFSGDVNPGTSPGILTITTPPGGLTQGPLSTLNIELDGPTAGTEHDRLSLSGNVTLNGGLVVTRSFTPTLGDRFAILTFANRTGQFASVTLPAVDGLVLDTLWAVDADPVDTLYIVATAATPPGPPGTEAAWLGTVSADWADPQNWFGGQVPDDTTSTFVQAGTPFSPQLAIGQTGQTDTLILDTGASLTVDGSLSVFGDLDAGFESIGGSGTVTLAGITGVVSGSLPRTVVAGDYTVVGPLLVNGELRLEGSDSTAPDVPGTNLRLNGNKVVVTGDFNTALFGRLHMLNAADTLEVQGGATFAGDETVNALTAGTLLVAGDFAQVSTIRSASFQGSGTHRTVLNGTGVQSVSIGDQLGLSRFATLVVDNTTAVTFTTPVTATGPMTVTAPIPITASSRLRVDGPVAFDPAASLTAPYLEFGGALGVTAGNFAVDTVAVRGTTLPDSLPYATVIIGGASGALAGPTTVTGNLLVQSVFNVSGQTLVVNGDLIVADGQSAQLRMQLEADSVVVLGSTVFNGAAASGTDLSAGVLDLKGDFTQTGTAGPFPAGGNNFVAGGTHRTRFSGTVTQNITFSHPDSSLFNDLLITNASAPVVMLSDAAAVGDVTVPAGTGLQGGAFGLSVLGDVTVGGLFLLDGLGVFGTLNANPGSYGVTTTIFGNPAGQIIPDSLPYTNVSVLTDAQFAGATTLSGLLSVVGDPAGAPVVLALGSATVEAAQLVVQGSGVLNMTDPDGLLTIGEDVLFDGFSTAGALTAGTLRVGGGFTQLATNDPQSFAASPGHLVQFLGGVGTQTVTFASPGSSASHFGDVRYSTNSAVMTLASPVTVAGTFATDPALGFFRQVAGSSGTPLTTASLDADSLEFAGVPVTITNATVGLTDVHFTSQDPTVTQLEVRGATGGVTFTSTRFFTQPGSGRYLFVADDTGPADGAFTLTMDQTIPTIHDGFAQTDGVAQLLGWPGAGPSQVLFSSAGGDPLGLFSANADGSGLTNISATEGNAGLVHPRWSPDRTRLAYSFSPIGQPYNHLRVGAADGSAFAAVVTDVSTYRPRYGLNGVHLAFECIPEGTEEVCVVDVSAPIENLNGVGDGDGRIIVSDAAETIDPAFTTGPAGFAWNPSFLDEIAFFRDTTNIDGAVVSHLFRASYDGSTVNLYTPDGMDDGQGPLRVVGTIDWSVDGLIAFTAYPAGQSPFNTDLYVIGADGTGLRRLTAMSAVVGPVFSPDGSEILFAYTGDGAKIYRIASTGQPNDEIPIHFGYFNWFPLEDLGWDWSPDGTEIVLADPTYSDAELVIVKVKSTTTDATYTDDRVLIGRVGGAASVTDRQPSWRP